nr:neurofilament medium polypeptide [Ipomoea batatas]
MEDSFRVRVDKAFGSLLASPPSSSNSRGKETSSLPLSSLWCLTDDEIQRKEWNRDPGDHDFNDSMPYPPNLDGFVLANNNHTDNVANTPQTVVPSSSQPGPSSSDLNQQLETDLVDIDDLSEDYGDDDEDEEPNSKSKRQRGSPNEDDESNIRSSIGQDCTLDYEEEEDEYDKVAVGSEKVSDHCLYMRDATEYGIGVNTYNELPDTLQDFVRDPRADHAAAKLRLKEDAEAAGNFDLLRLSDAPEISSFVVLEDGSSRKSIIKKREGLKDVKSQKRVRFNNNSTEGNLIATKDNCPIKEEKASGSGEGLNMIQDTSVPDYIRNPSNYTHYTFDTATDMDDDSNRKAYLNFLSLVRKPGITTTTVQHQDDLVNNPPKSVIFNLKKASLDVHTDKVGNKYPNVHVEKYSRVGIALSDDAPEDEVVSAMEEDDHGIAVDTMNITLKSSRQYRVRTKTDFDDQE